MTKPLALLALAVAALFGMIPAGDAVAETVSIRLVKAGTGTGIDPKLQDVAPLMKGNLAFSSFDLVDSASVTLPDPAPVKMGRGYKIALKGTAGNLDITVSQAGRNLIRTHVVLRGPQPLVLGGVASRDGTMLFVLNLQKEK